MDEAIVERASLDARLGADPSDLKRAIASAAKAKASLAEPDQKRWGLYSIQCLFLTFLEDAGVREERVPDDRGEVIFYNLGKFSQLISDYEAIHFHSKPAEKYESFADFLQYRAEDAYPEGWQDNQYANPDALRGGPSCSSLPCSKTASQPRSRAAEVSGICFRVQGSRGSLASRGRWRTSGGCSTWR